MRFEHGYYRSLGNYIFFGWVFVFPTIKFGTRIFFNTTLNIVLVSYGIYITMVTFLVTLLIH